MKEGLLFEPEVSPIESEALPTYTEIVKDLEMTEQLFGELQASLFTVETMAKQQRDSIIAGPEAFHLLCNRIMADIDRVMSLRHQLEEDKLRLESRTYEVN